MNSLFAWLAKNTHKLRKNFAQLVDICFDLIESHFPVLAFQKKKDNILRKVVQFTNPGFDLINIQNILKMPCITSKLPPCITTDIGITYAYTKPIRNKVLNYADVVASMEGDTPPPYTCDCAKHPKYCGENIGHVMTGDLSIISLKTLQDMLKKGPNFREPVPIDWDETKMSLMRCMEEFRNDWSRKHSLWM